MRLRSLRCALAVAMPILTALIPSCALLISTETISGDVIDAGAGGAGGSHGTSTSASYIGGGGAGGAAGPTSSGSGSGPGGGGGTGGTGTTRACADRVSWSAFITGNAEDIVMAIATPTLFYLAATVTGELMVGQTTAPPPLGGGADGDVLVIAYDLAKDQPVWVKRFGTAGQEEVKGAVVHDGKLLLAVNYDGAFGFDPGCNVPMDPGHRRTAIVEVNSNEGGYCPHTRDFLFGAGETHDLALDEDSLWAVCTSDAFYFVSRFATDFVGAPATGGASPPDIKKPSIAPLVAKAVVVGGFDGTLTIPHSAFELDAKGTDAFLASFVPATDMSLDVVAGQSGAAFGDDAFQSFNQVRTDGTSLFVIGENTGTMNMGKGDLQSAGAKDIVVGRYSDALACAWSAQFGGAGNETGASIAVGSGLVAIAGGHDADLEIGTNLTTVGGTDVFVAALDKADGAPQWACSFGGENEDIAKAVAVTSNGSVLLAGTFSGQASFGKDLDGGFGSIFVIALDGGK